MPAIADPLSVAIYARFSSDRQNNRSSDDQLVLGREYAARQGWNVVATYSDDAISGASVEGRDAFQRMMRDAEAGRFAILLADNVDRYGRNTADLMRFQEIAEFIGVRVFTIADGEANDLVFGFKSLTSARWLKDHARNVRRGLDAVVRDRRHAGGRLYGYAAAPGGAPGQLAIVEHEAAIVRRIFVEYLAGASPRAIAHRLNVERVPAPRGRQWNASTINGSRARGSGILFNALYAGELVWNRVRMVKKPGTNKRLSRINPPDAQRRVAMPELAIVSAETFAAARARKDGLAAVRPELQRRPRHLLSGLLRCAACAGGMSTAGRDKSGRLRVRCSNHKESRTCPAPATFYLDAIETRVLGALRAEMRAPTVIAEYVREYHAERARLAAGGRQRREAIERRQAQIERELPNLVDAIAQNIGDRAVIGARMKDLAAEREAHAGELAALGAPASVVALHPAVLARYEAQIGRLQETLAAQTRDAGAAEALRELIETVAVGRSADAGNRLQVAITGRLDAMVGTTAFPSRIVGGNVGSGGSLQPFPTGRPARFVLAIAS